MCIHLIWGKSENDCVSSSAVYVCLCSAHVCVSWCEFMHVCVCEWRDRESERERERDAA